jgi:hypothetical protein
MNRSESFAALRRANPRAKEGFAQSVGAAAEAALQRIHTADAEVPRIGRRRRLLRVSAAGAGLAAIAIVATLLTAGSPGGSGVEDATAAVRNAASVTAASAERSGTAVVRITQNGEVWAGTTIRWHGGDLAVSSDAPRRHGRAGSELRVVGGTMYGVDPVVGSWVVLGRPKSIDPGSGTTPDDYLTAVREDVGGATLRRFTDGMTGLTTRRRDSATVYSGAVAAGLIARETGFKEGGSIRILPFGYVAHDEAADPAAPLDVAVSVGADGVVREIALTWGTSASAWTYTVTYSGLGTTSPPVAPANPRPLNRRAGTSAGQ